MESKKIPYLCGGTLFFLLVQAKKPRTSARERKAGVKDHLSDPEMMEGLIQAITVNDTCIQGDSLKKNTSQFRECLIDGSTYIPFSDNATAKSYDYEVINNYSSALLRMQKFAGKFIDPTKAAWLVRILLDVVEQDAGDDDWFYVQHSGLPLSKSVLLEATNIEFQPFLVGIIHYILMYRPDNRSGQATLNAWGLKESGSERKLNNSFSLGSSRKVDVVWYTSTEDDTITEGSGANEDQNTESEYADTEVINESSHQEDHEAKTVHQSVFINNGSGIQIGVNYGEINLSPRRNEKGG